MRATAAVAVCLLLAGTVAGCSPGKSQAEIQKECQAALSSKATKTDRPDACEDLSQADYDTLLTDWALKNALDGMSKKDRDTLDYYDDGSIDGSIG